MRQYVLDKLGSQKWVDDSRGNVRKRLQLDLEKVGRKKMRRWETADFTGKTDGRVFSREEGGGESASLDKLELLMAHLLSQVVLPFHFALLPFSVFGDCNCRGSCTYLVFPRIFTNQPDVEIQGENIVQCATLMEMFLTIFLFLGV